MSQCFRVTTQSQLQSVMKTAKGGDTIMLADGKYGAVYINNDYTSKVTIRAENAQKATFDKLTIKGATNITVDGLQIHDGVGIEGGSAHIGVRNTTIDEILYCRNVNGLVVDNVDVSGGRFGMLLNSIQNFSVTNSTFGKVTEDVMRITGNSYNGVIENNVLADTIAKYPTHPDMLQMFAVNNVTPHDIVIRGNVFFDNPATGSVGAQGIFMSDAGSGGYRNILIEDNLINVSSPNSIYVNGGQSNVVIKDNTLMPNSSDGGAIIRLVSKSGFDNHGTTLDGNVVKMILDETHKSDIGDNYVYGRWSDHGSLFSGPDGSSWENFLPPEGSPVDFGSGHGATSRLAELLKQDYGKDTVVVPDAVDVVPAPTPEPTPDAGSVYHSAGTHTLDGHKGSVVTVASDKVAMADEGTISFSFNADSVHGGRGLISKGAAGHDDDLSVWIQNGKLVVAFENDEGRSGSFSHSGIRAGTDYSVQVTYDEETVKAFVNGALVGTKNFDLDMSGNDEALVVGAINGSSRRGTTDHIRSIFDGKISDVAIYDHALTPEDLMAHLSPEADRSAHLA